MIHCRHHGWCRTVVIVQGVNAPRTCTAGSEISMDIRATECINCLLRIANQGQQHVLPIRIYTICTVVDLILDWVGVLKLVDERGRELSAYQLGQPLTVRPL